MSELAWVCQKVVGSKPNLPDRLLQYNYKPICAITTTAWPYSKQSSGMVFGCLHEKSKTIAICLKIDLDALQKLGEQNT